MTDEEQPSELDKLVDNIMATLEAEDLKEYTPDVVREFRDPANVGPLDEADGHGVADGLCLDTMHMWVKLRKGRIQRCTFYTDGCGATIACGSRLTRLVSGRLVSEAMTIRPEDLIGSLGGLPEDHVHCASLAVIALRNAIRDSDNRGSSRKEGRQ